MKNYTKKPVTIQAVQFNGENIQEIIDFVGQDNISADDVMGWSIKTLEGNMLISHGDYVIRGIKGEFYPCKEDIFNMTYDEAGTDESTEKKLELTINGDKIRLRAYNLKHHYEIIGLLRYTLVASEQKAIKISENL